MRFLLTFLALSTVLSAQNLVVNPGFEGGKNQRSNILGNAQLDGWTMPSDGTSDYIVADKEMRKNSRNKKPGYAYIIPFKGDACVGFLTVEGGYEYVCGTLSKPLIKDSSYTISFAIATTNDEAFSLDRIGVYFTQKENPYFKERGMPRITWDPQVTLAAAVEGESDGYWQVYTTNYIAEGGEISFVIGDFTSTFEDDPRLTGQAYYFFVDEVFIVPTFEIDSIDSAATDTSVADTLIAMAEPEVISVDTFIAAGKTLTLENIYFETNKSRILPESYQPLYDIIIELKLQPNLKVEIVGHTDKHGDPKANQKLSEERAKAVADFFTSKGIDPSRITTRGEGQSKPVSEVDRKNRRVEFIFTE